MFTINTGILELLTHLVMKRVEPFEDKLKQSLQIFRTW